MPSTLSAVAAQPVAGRAAHADATEVTDERSVNGAVHKAMRHVAAAILLAVVAAEVLILTTPKSPLFLAADYFTSQDVWTLLGAVSCLWLLSGRPPAAFLPWPSAFRRAKPELVLHSCVAVVFGVSLVGTFVLHGSYDFVRDELMATFDARIFGHGLFMAPVAEQWRGLVPSMLPRFGVSVVDNAAWASAYLPGNAAFRALVGAAVVPQLANPLLAASAAWATWSLARLFWPQRPDAAIVAIVLLATSTQVLFMAMTSFAMTGHLLLNLVWLRLFLRNDRAGHLGACIVGALACGWHQLAFHPLFVLPFIGHLWWTRRWTAAAGYSLFYVTVCALWIVYGRLASVEAGVTLSAGVNVGPGLVNYWHVTLRLLGDFSWDGLLLMLFNVLRFVAWQNPMLLALVAAAAVVPRQLPVPIRLALCGLALTLAVATAVQPFQGHGWGYRYVHGYIGALCLVAASAWVIFVPDVRISGRGAWPLLAAACGYVVFVQLPVQAFQVHGVLAPRIEASAVIARSGADFVVVDQRGLFFAEDLVRNDPLLQRKPVTLNLLQLKEREIARLCEHSRHVAIFDQTHAAAQGMLGFDLQTAADEIALNRAKPMLMALPCLMPLEAR